MLSASWIAYQQGGLKVPIAGSCVLLAFLIGLSAIDFQTGLLPNWLTLPLIGLGLVQNWAIGNDVAFFIIGGIVGYLAVYLLSAFWSHYRGEQGIGLGDAKLLAAAGTWLGPLNLPGVLLIASTAGLAVVIVLSLLKREAVRSRQAIPFGPYIALGMWTIWCNTILQVY